MHVCTYVRTYVCVCMCVYIVRIYVCMCMYVRIYAYACMRVYVYMYVCMCVSMYMHACVYICTRLYVGMHKLTTHSKYYWFTIVGTESLSWNETYDDRFADINDDQWRRKKTVNPSCYNYAHLTCSWETPEYNERGVRVSNLLLNLLTHHTHGGPKWSEEWQ